MAAVSRGAFAAALAAPRARVRRRPLAGVRRPSGLVVASSTADADLSDNVWPPEMDERTFRLKPQTRRGSGPNPMRDARKEAQRMKRRSPGGEEQGEGDDPDGDEG